MIALVVPFPCCDPVWGLFLSQSIWRNRTEEQGWRGLECLGGMEQGTKGSTHNKVLSLILERGGGQPICLTCACSKSAISEHINYRHNINYIKFKLNIIAI